MVNRVSPNGGDIWGDVYSADRRHKRGPANLSFDHDVFERDAARFKDDLIRGKVFLNVLLAFVQVINRLIDRNPRLRCRLASSR